jgi:GNAT superfamily N-acetyltransferase
MNELSLTQVRSQRELIDFIHFPWEVYRENRYWVPPIISERVEFLDPEHNPFFQHATAEYYLAHRGPKIVGTIAAFTNDRYNEFQGVNTGFFGFFEVLEDQEAALALLKKAEEYATHAGHDSLLGPAQFSTNDEVGMLADGFDGVPRVLMPYNPPRYVDYVEAAGYQKAMDLWSYKVKIDDFIHNIPPKLLRVVEKVQARRNLLVRKINMKDFDQEVERFKRVYNQSWERNWGFVPMTDPEIEQMAKQLKSILDPDLVLMVEHEGEVIGVALSLPDLCQPLHKAYPRPGFPEILTMLKLLWHWRVRGDISWVRVFALGVMPEFRGLGVDAMMYLETAKSAARKGYEWAEMSWILENNDMMNRSIQLLGGEVYRTHRLYEKRL